MQDVSDWGKYGLDIVPQNDVQNLIFAQSHPTKGLAANQAE